MKTLILCLLCLIANDLFAAKVAIDMSGTGTAVTALTGWEGACHLDSLPLVSFTAGDSIYIRGSGAVTLSINISAVAGTDVDMIWIAGVKNTTTNWPPLWSDISIDSVDRPSINMGSDKRFTIGSNYIVEGLHFYGSYSQIVLTGNYNIFKNFSINHDQGELNTENAIQIYGGSYFEDCHIISDGNAFGVNSNVRFLGGLIRAQNVGVIMVGSNITIIGTTFDGGTLAISMGSYNGLHVQNCNFLDIDTVLSSTTGAGIIWKNNIIDSTCEVSYKISTPKKFMMFNRNLIDSASTSVRYIGYDSTGIYADRNEVNADPLIIDQATGQLDPESPAINAGKW